jgi:hypothetical protein
MKKVIAALCLLFLGSLAFGQAALGSVKSVSGKVELMGPGGSWASAKPGDQIVKGMVVSVGFKSAAVISTPDALITVKALTRLTIEDIVKTQGGTKTDLYLSAGRVKTEVKPEAGQKSDFRVRSPTATASVRGTGFSFDGVNLAVFHGLVKLSSASGRSRLVGRGYAAFVTSGGDVPIPELGDEGSVVLSGARFERQSSGAGGTGLPPPPAGPTETPEPGDAPIAIAIE